MELLALSFPWGLQLLLILALNFLLFKKRTVVLIVLVVAELANCHFECLPMNLPHSIDYGTLKVMSFNCNLSPNRGGYHEQRATITEIIREQDADVVFLTENFIMREDSLWLDLQELYPYRSRKNSVVGNRLYSKYPIVYDSLLTENRMAYGITWCRIDLKGKVMNVVGVHLSSNNYNEEMVYMTPDSVESGSEARTYLKNIMVAGEYRQMQATSIIGMMEDDGKVPTIVMGDFNDVCGSPTLNILEHGGLKDAWWHGGCGYGATIHKPLPYRIDHILYNKGLKLKCIQKVDCRNVSDHDMLVGYFEM